MLDDFNTPLAISVLFDLANEVNKSKSSIMARQLKSLAAVIAVLQRTPLEFLHSSPIFSDDAVALEIERKIADRKLAKETKNFSESDRIRIKLLAEGVILDDRPGGATEWCGTRAA